MKSFLLAGVFFAGMGCPHPTPPPVPPTPMQIDASVNNAVDGPASCATACAHEAALGCPGAHPTARGATCVEVCTNTLDSPILWDLHCRSVAPTCAAIDACER